MINNAKITIYRNCVSMKNGNCPYMILNKYFTECCAIDKTVQVKYFGCTPYELIKKGTNMDTEQFCKLMEKLEEIRCGIINVEETITPIDQIRKAFFHQLEAKTGWGRNEIKNIFNMVVKSII